MIQDTQEYLQHWEKKNNPFYPSEMRWNRVKINQMLAEYEAQKIVLQQADVMKSVCPECKEPHRTDTKTNEQICPNCGNGWQTVL